jgi:hypothetical protein
MRAKTRKVNRKAPKERAGTLPSISREVDQSESQQEMIPERKYLMGHIRKTIDSVNFDELPGKFEHHFDMSPEAIQWSVLYFVIRKESTYIPLSRVPAIVDKESYLMATSLMSARYPHLHPVETEKQCTIRRHVKLDSDEKDTGELLDSRRTLSKARYKGFCCGGCH